MFGKLNDIFEGVLPENKPGIETPDTSKESIDLWFSSIHLTNAEESLAQISAFLKQTNQSVIPLSEREYLLDILHEPIISLAGHLKTKYLDTELPIPGSQRERVNNCIKVYNILINSHAIILHELLEEKENTWSLFKTSDKKTASVIQRITRYLTQVVLTKFEIYSQPSIIVWKKLYSLYHYAEDNRLEDILIADPLINGKSSIKLTFLQALLLALSDPYRFNQQQIYYIYKNLAHWSKLVDITSQKRVNSEFYLAINITDSYMPTFYPRGQNPGNINALFIDSHRLTIDELDESNEATIGFLSPNIKKGLLNQLRSSLAVYVERHYDRHEYYSELKVVFGIKHVHYVLNKYQDPIWLTNAKFESRIKNMEDLDYESLIEELYTTKAKKKVTTFKMEKFLTENESLNGLSLIWVNDYTVKLKIGEVIALSHEKSDYPNDWFVGVIRRLQHLNNEPLKVGIQLLVPQGAKPVTIRRENTKKAYRAIYLPSFEMFNEHITLVTDSLTFSPGEKLFLSDSHLNQQSDVYEEQIIYLCDNIETTPFYMRFNIIFG